MLKHFYNLSLKGKLSTIILLTGIFLLGLVFSALFTHEVYSLKNNLRDDLLTLAQITGRNGSVGLVFKDQQATKDTLDALSAKTNIILAQVFDDKGKRFAGYFRTEADQNIADSVDLGDYYYAHPQVLKRAPRNPQLTPDKISDEAIFGDNHVDVFKKIVMNDKVIGIVHIQSDLEQFNQRLYWYGGVMTTIMLVSLFPALMLASRLQQSITRPIYCLLQTMNRVTREKNYTLRAEKNTGDEIGKLIDDFNSMLKTVEQRDQEIISLNDQLKQENRRMSAELDVAKQLQEMVLPKDDELERIEELDIAGFMEPADEVGGDYYDVLHCDDGRISISIGDVTGHGLESGVVMIMVQMAVRTLLINGVNDPRVFLGVLNRALYQNVQRMNTDKNLTLALLNYQDGELQVSGQHEEVLVIRQGGTVERHDTSDLGFMVGLVEDISHLIANLNIHLNPGDAAVLYTDGVTEARNPQGQLYGVENLCRVLERVWDNPARQIQQAIIDDLRGHISTQKVFDDITLLVLKRRST